MLDQKVGKAGDPPYSFPAGTIVIDEAGQLNRPQIMIPVVRFQQDCKRLVLTGDYKQFPGISFDKEVKL